MFYWPELGHMFIHRPIVNVKIFAIVWLKSNYFNFLALKQFLNTFGVLLDVYLEVISLLILEIELFFFFLCIKILASGDFPGGTERGCLIPGWGTKIPYGLWPENIEAIL